MKTSNVGILFMAIGWFILTSHMPGWRGILSFAIFGVGLEFWHRETTLEATPSEHGGQNG